MKRDKGGEYSKERETVARKGTLIKEIIEIASNCNNIHDGDRRRGRKNYMGGNIPGEMIYRMKGLNGK